MNDPALERDRSPEVPAVPVCHAETPMRLSDYDRGRQIARSGSSAVKSQMVALEEGRSVFEMLRGWREETREQDVAVVSLPPTDESVQDKIVGRPKVTAIQQVMQSEVRSALWDRVVLLDAHGLHKAAKIIRLTIPPVSGEQKPLVCDGCAEVMVWRVPTVLNSSKDVSMWVCPTCEKNGVT